MKLFIAILLFFCLPMYCNAQKLQYKYDKANRLIQVTYPNHTSVIYTYDKDGNRTQANIVSSMVCRPGQAAFYAGTNDPAYTYQWQVDQGSGFTNLTIGGTITNVTTHTLIIPFPPTSFYGYKYRCQITTPSGVIYSAEETLKIIANWTGTVSTAWENPANWACNFLPDVNTDVYVSGGTPFSPLVSSMASCRGLILSNNAICTISAGYNLLIAGL